MEEENLETKYSTILDFISGGQLDAPDKTATQQSEISLLLERYLTQKVNFKQSQEKVTQEKTSLENELNALKKSPDIEKKIGSLPEINLLDSPGLGPSGLFVSQVLNEDTDDPNITPEKKIEDLKKIIVGLRDQMEMLELNKFQTNSQLEKNFESKLSSSQTIIEKNKQKKKGLQELNYKASEKLQTLNEENDELSNELRRKESFIRNYKDEANLKSKELKEKNDNLAVEQDYYKEAYEQTKLKFDTLDEYHKNSKDDFERVKMSRQGLHDNLEYELKSKEVVISRQRAEIKCKDNDLLVIEQKMMQENNNQMNYQQKETDFDNEMRELREIHNKEVENLKNQITKLTAQATKAQNRLKRSMTSNRKITNEFDSDNALKLDELITNEQDMNALNEYGEDNKGFDDSFRKDTFIKDDSYMSKDYNLNDYVSYDESMASIESVDGKAGVSFDQGKKTLQKVSKYLAMPKEVMKRNTLGSELSKPTVNILEHNEPDENNYKEYLNQQTDLNYLTYNSQVNNDFTNKECFDQVCQTFILYKLIGMPN